MVDDLETDWTTQVVGPPRLTYQLAWDTAAAWQDATDRSGRKLVLANMFGKLTLCKATRRQLRKGKLNP